MQRLRLLRFHGIERDAWKRYGKASNPSYDIAEPGFKYNMSDVQAAIGIAQMKKLEIITRRRREIAKAYLEGMKGISGLDLPGSPAYEHKHSWHLFIIKAKRMSRGELMAALAEENIGYGLHFPACHTLKYVREMFGGTSLPVTEDVSEKILSLPIYPSMTDEEVATVINAVRRIFS
jgi:dTDP-4-amino-4,6-dideoxygalactose transaminase